MKEMAASRIQDLAQHRTEHNEGLYTTSPGQPISPKYLEAMLYSKGRFQTANRLLEQLKCAAARAWEKTESLLARTIRSQMVEGSILDPAQIIRDCCQIYEMTLDTYTRRGLPRQIAVWVASEDRDSAYREWLEVGTERAEPSRLASVIGPHIGTMRRRYGDCDPRLLGFVSLQFHYTGQFLLECLEPLECVLVEPFFKAIDDHLYLPLQQAYEAAANCDEDAIALVAVRQLLPASSAIANSIYQHIQQAYPTYNSYSGCLNDPTVRASSLRDIEMFQVYLYLCVLEGHMAAVQQELFPLCEMLYPVLRVDWSLVQQMICFLDREIQHRLEPVLFESFVPYVQALWEIFAPEMLSDPVLDKLDRSHPSVLAQVAKAKI